MVDWKAYSGIVGAVGLTFTVLVGFTPALDAVDSFGFPVPAMRAYCRTVVAQDRQANLVIRDVLFDVATARREEMAQDRDRAREKLSLAVDPDVRTAWRDNLDNHSAAIERMDESIKRLKHLRQAP